MREFWLKDADGAEWDLTDSSSTFLHTVSGLGYEYTQDIQRYGSMYEAYYEVLAQKKVTGSVYFAKENNASNYFNFIRFIQNKPLTLCYKPDSTTYYLDGDIAIVGKTEGTQRAVTIEFRGSTSWYREVSVYNDGTLEENEGFPYTFDFYFTDDAPQSVAIESDSHGDSPMRIEIYGPCTNPSWTHYVDSEVYCTGTVNVTVPSNRKLVIDTTAIPPSIKVVTLANVQVQDAYALSDFSTERFSHLQFGNNRVTVTHEGDDVCAVAMIGRVTYASV